MTAALVSVFVCGVQKGGTTSLHAHFTDHPQLADPSRKETHFFDNEGIDWEAPDYELLHSFFEADAKDRIRYDITPITMFWPPALGRITRYNPAAKLIFLLRDPFERAWSHWCMEWARNAETLSFADAIRQGRLRLENLPPTAPEWRVYSYLERGLYTKQIRRALDLFPREQLLFLRSDDLRDHHRETLNSIAVFLGISPFPDTGPKRERTQPSRAWPTEPTVADRQLVADFVRGDLLQLRALTGINTSQWPSAQAPPISAPSLRSSPADRRPNVLMIVADDLNSWIGALGTQPDVRTPAIDALAARGTLFTRAYCAAPYCNASRMSAFTGCLPTTTGIYQNEPYWDAPFRRKTYIESFREAGYYTFGAGKVFHGVYDYAKAGRERAQVADWIEMENRANLWDRFDVSQPEPLPYDRPLNRLFDHEKFDKVPSLYHHFDWGPIQPQAEEELPDEHVCRSIEDFLRNLPDQPFFCAAGLYKPHLPWHAPQRFFDLYDQEKLTLPVVRDDDLDDVPPIARKWALSPRDHQLVTSRGQWRCAVQGYLAAISYADWLVGRMVAALDAAGLSDNTVIALWGDNGFHLGEKLHWRKFVLWEEATRVPMIIVPPKGHPSVPFVDNPVGLLNLFPTLADLCGVDHPHFVNGSSLMRQVQGGANFSMPVCTTWKRGNHSIRADDWRYTVYSDGEEELYNHSSDPREWTNLAADPRFASVIARLRQFVPSDAA